MPTIPRRLHELRVPDERRHCLPPLRAQRRRGHRQAGRQRGALGLRQPSRLKGWIDMAAVSRYRQRPLSVSLGEPGFLMTSTSSRTRWATSGWPRPVTRSATRSLRDLLGAGRGPLELPPRLRRFVPLRGGLAGQRGRRLHGGCGRRALLRARPLSHGPPAEGEGAAADAAAQPGGRSPTHQPRRRGGCGHRYERDPHSAAHRRDGPAPAGLPPLPEGVPARLRLPHEPGTEPAPEDLEAVERVRRAFGAHFFALTNGVGWADTSLATPPPAPRAASPDLARALAWLAARQALDGSWSDSAETRVRDTSSAVQSLLRAGAAGPTAQRGLVWLQGVQPESLDFQARAAAALEPGFLLVADRSTRVARVLGGQNPDGGFGAGRDFASDPLDTALALRALKALGHSRTSGCGARSRPSMPSPAPTAAGRPSPAARPRPWSPPRSCSRCWTGARSRLGRAAPAVSPRSSPGATRTAASGQPEHPARVPPSRSRCCWCRRGGRARRVGDGVAAA